MAQNKPARFDLFDDIHPERNLCSEVYHDLGVFIDYSLGNNDFKMDDQLISAMRLQELIFYLVEKGIKTFTWEDVSLYCSNQLCINDYLVFHKLPIYYHDDSRFNKKLMEIENCRREGEVNAKIDFSN